MTSRHVVFAAMLAALFLAALDMYVVASVLPGMIDDFSVPVSHLERATPIVSGFLLGYVAAMPVVAGMADRRGRVLAMTACLVAFAAGSLVTANAADLRALVVGRAVQGAAGGALVPLAFAAATELFGSGSRLLALGAVAGFQELGSLLGPIYGALVSRIDAEHLHWRLIFWLNLPLAALCLIVFLAASVRSGHAQPTRTRWDPLSSLLLGGALGALVVALYPDNPSASPVNATSRLLPGLAVTVLLAMAFAWRAFRGRTFLSADLLRSARFGGTLLTNVLVGGSLAAALVEIPLLARTVFGLDELGSAALLARFMAGIPIGALIGAWAAERLGLRPVVCTGLAIAAACFYLMAGWDTRALQPGPGGFPRAYVVLVLAGFGFGIVIAPLAYAVLERTARFEQARAASTVVLGRMVGMLIGLALLSGIGLHHFYELVNAPPRPHPVFGSPDFLKQAAALQQRYQASLLAEYRQIFLIAGALCLAAALVAVLSVGPVRRVPPSAPRTAGA